MPRVSVRTARVSVRVVCESKDDVRVDVDARQTERKPLRFGHGNAKLDKAIFTFSLPAGHTCPFARDCKSKADRKTGYINDGPEVQFRCYAASMEARHSSVRRSRWHNLEQLLACDSVVEMAELILDSLTPFA